MIQRFVLAAALAAAASVAQAQKPAAPQGPMIDGYLCCNVRTYGKQVSDIQYAEQGTQLIAVGTPVRITDYDFRWFDAEVGGRPQRFKNDYSRDLTMTAFAQRYVVAEDPRLKLASFAEPVRAAILAARVRPGMTREQVVMALGYPVTSENPRFDARVWKFWLDTWAEFQVSFDDAGLVKAVSGDPATLERVTATP